MGSTVEGVDREISKYEHQWWRKQAGSATLTSSLVEGPLSHRFKIIPSR